MGGQVANLFGCLRKVVSIVVGVASAVVAGVVSFYSARACTCWPLCSAGVLPLDG